MHSSSAATAGFETASNRTTGRAITTNPSDAESSATRGAILVWAGRAEEALPWAEGAPRVDPANARASLFLGMAYYFLDRYGDAAVAMDLALAGNLGRNTQLTGRPHLGGNLGAIEQAAGRRARAECGDACRRFSTPSGSLSNSAHRTPVTVWSTF